MVRAPAIQKHLWFLSRLKWAMLFSDLLPKPALSKRPRSSMVLSRFQSRHSQKTSSASKDEGSLLSVVILWLPSNFRGILKKTTLIFRFLLLQWLGLDSRRKSRKQAQKRLHYLKLCEKRHTHVCNPWEFLIAVQRKIFQCKWKGFQHNFPHGKEHSTQSASESL